MSEFDIDEIFFNSIKFNIDKNVYDNVNQAQKLNIQIDYKEIEEQCQKKHFKRLENQIVKSINSQNDFYILLKDESNFLYQKIIENINNKYRNMDELNEKIKQCKALVDFNELLPVNILSKSEIKEIYVLGKAWFDKKDYNNSTLYFSFLTSIESENGEFWLAKGISEQNQQRYEESLASYTIAIQTDPTILITYLQVIDCLLLLSKSAEALDLYDFFINEIKIKDYENDSFIINKLENIKKNLGRVVN